MSGLAALRAGRTPPGAYRWRSAPDLGDLRHAVEVGGGRLAHVHGPGEPTARAMHDALADALGFAAWHGHNLDALADSLRDVAPDTVVLWEGWADLAGAEPRRFPAAVRLLGERVVLLLAGDGPDLPDLADLG